MPAAWRKAALAPLLVLCAPLPAWAQDVQPPTREELAPGRLDERPEPDSRLSVEGGLERGPCPLADPGFADVRVTFSTVEFTGLPDIPPAALEPAWRGLAGRDLPIATLCDIRDRATAILSGLGYLAAVQVPPQRIEANGTVTMDVLAARLVEVEVRGDAGRSERLIAAHLANLTERRWFNVGEAERHLLLLQDLPGVDVRLALRSAEREPGEVVGDVQIVHRPVELLVAAQNLGARATGREGAFAELALNGLLGLGDRTTFSIYNTFDWDEQRILRASHELALDADGLRLGGSILYAESKPDLAGGAFATETLAAEIHLSKALVRRQANSLFLAGGLELVDQDLAFGATPLSEDKLRVLFARADHVAVDPASIRGVGGYSIREPRWRNAFSLELRKGTGLFGASDDCEPIADCLPPNVPLSNVLADPAAFVVRLEDQLEFRPAPQVTLAVSPLAQVSDGPLLSYEQVSLGNYTIGRGLDPGVVQADSAVGASFELRYGSLYPREPDAVALEPFVFLDYAKGWIDDDELNPDPRAVLTAGGGVRGRWGDRLDFGLVLAAPLQRAGYQTERGDVRVLVTLAARLLPWGDR